MEFNLEKVLKSEKFVIETQHQIIKDFAKLNLFFPDSFENSIQTKEEIEILVSDKLLEILNEGETRLLQLLYMIDIPEKDFLALTGDSDLIQKLSAKILHREAYKVFLREKFSS